MGSSSMRPFVRSAARRPLASRPLAGWSAGRSRRSSAWRSCRRWAAERRSPRFARRPFLAIVTRRTLLAIVPWPVAVAAQLLSEPAPLFVARDLKTIARVHVRAAGAPVAGPGFPWCAPLRIRLGTLLFLRLPQASSGEPLHHRVRVPRLQLPKRGRELFRGMRAKGGRLAFEDDRPVMVPGRHAPIMAALQRRSARAASAFR